MTEKINFWRWKSACVEAAISFIRSGKTGLAVRAMELGVSINEYGREEYND